MDFVGFGRRDSYYAVLGVRPDSPAADVRRAYKKLAMKWHPDKWSTDTEMAEEAKRRFQAVQEAYEVLSNERKRTLYDAGLYDSGETEDEAEGFAEFVKELAGMMENVRREERSYSMEELWGMLQDMGCSGSEGSHYPPRSACSDRLSDGSRCSKKKRKRGVGGKGDDRTVGMGGLCGWDGVLGNAGFCQV